MGEAGGALLFFRPPFYPRRRTRSTSVYRGNTRRRHERTVGAISRIARALLGTNQLHTIATSPTSEYAGR